MDLEVFIVETFQALVSNDHIYSVINIVLVIQQVSVESGETYPQTQG